MRLPTVLLALLCGPLAHAAGKPPEVAPAAAAAAPPVLPASVFRDYRAADLCLDIGASLSRSDLSVLEQHLDIDALLRRAIPAGLAPEVAKGVESGARSSLLASMRATFRGEKMQWRTLLQEPGTPRERCTLGAVSEGGVVLIDLLLVPRDGRPVIVDMRNYAMGRNSSELMYRFFTYMLPMELASGWNSAATHEKLAQRLAGDDRLPRVLAFSSALGRADPAAVNAAFDRLPADARREPALLIRAIDASRDDPERYSRYLEQLAAIVGDDPDFSFALVDHYFLKRDKPRLLRARERVTRMAPGFLPTQFMGLGIEREFGSVASMRAALAATLALDDGFETLYWLMAEEAAGRRDFDTAVTALKVLQARFHYDFTQLREPRQPYMKVVKESAPYRAWMAQEAAAREAADSR